MPKLDLFKKRRFSTVRLNDGKEYKIPNEYTIEEVERLLELKAKEKDIKSLTAGLTEAEQKEQLDIFWSNIFAQLEIVFQSYQPEIDVAYLQKHVTHNEALEIVGFFQEYRALAVGNIDETANADSKKKLKN